MRQPTWLLRWRGGRLHNDYCRWIDQYGCGRELFEHINPEAHTLRLKVERIIEEIKQREVSA